MEKLSWPPFLLDSFLSKRPICLFVKLANICLKDLASVISNIEFKISGNYNDFKIYYLFNNKNFDQIIAFFEQIF